MLESIEFPAPVDFRRHRAENESGPGQAGHALGKLAQEDPTFRVHTDPDTGQTLISGMGELHLEIIVDRMLREFGVQATVGRPQVAYRETIKRNSIAEGKYIRQTGGRGQYGHCKIEVHPLPSSGHEDMHEMSTDEIDALAKEVAGKGGKWRFDKEHRFLFIDKIIGGAIPKEFVAPIEAGIREAMDNGILAGYEMVDIAVTLVDGSYHDVDSSEMAFKIAGLDGVQVSLPEGAPDAARADHAPGGCRSGRVHGRSYWRPEFAARTSAGHGIARGQPDHSLRSATGRNVRLRHRFAQPHARARQFFDAFFALRRGPGEHCRRSDLEVHGARGAMSAENFRDSGIRTRTKR